MAITLKRVQFQMMKNGITQVNVECVDEAGRYLHGTTDRHPGVEVRPLVGGILAGLDQLRSSQSFYPEDALALQKEVESGRIKAKGA